MTLLGFVLLALAQLGMLGLSIWKGRFIAFALVNAAVAVSVTVVHFRAVTSPDRSGRFVEAWKSLSGTAMAFTVFLYGVLNYERSGREVFFGVCAGLLAFGLVVSAYGSWQSLRAQRAAQSLEPLR
jgi:hypothetical protein